LPPFSDLATNIRRLKDGLPGYKPDGTQGQPSIPPESKHATVKSIVHQDFGLLKLSDFEKIYNNQSRCWPADPECKFNTFGSEAQIASELKKLFDDLIYAAGLSGKVRVLQEKSVFEIRPDMWFISVDGIPCGCGEVKNPSTKKVDVMDNGNVLGEVFDSLMQMPNFYGKKLAIGILMTGMQFRVCWIGNDDHVDMAEEEKLPSMEPTTPTKVNDRKYTDAAPPSPPERQTPSKKNPKVYGVEKATDDDGSDEHAPEADSDALSSETGGDSGAANVDRSLHMSQIVPYNAADHAAMRMLLSALLKMTRTSTSG
jgi:hypothetical protein